MKNDCGHSWRSQRGITLIVAMLMLLVITLASLGMMNAVTTSAQIASTLSARQRCQFMTEQIMRNAMLALPSIVTSGGGTSDNIARGYFANIQNTNTGGVPLNIAAGHLVGTVSSPRPGVTSSFMVERLCPQPAAGAANDTAPFKCVMAFAGDSKSENVLDSDNYHVLYRITTRTECARGGVVFGQTQRNSRAPIGS